LADVTERWLPGSNVRRDLLDCIYVAAIRLDWRSLWLYLTRNKENNHVRRHFLSFSSAPVPEPVAGIGT
jgi:hypothetical protein